VAEAEGDEVPPGWVRILADIDGVPMWRRLDEPCYVATRDMDQLRFIGAALTQFDRMSGPEYHAFVQQHNPK
jgi:hypothetical protein